MPHKTCTQKSEGHHNIWKRVPWNQKVKTATLYTVLYSSTLVNGTDPFSLGPSNSPARILYALWTLHLHSEQNLPREERQLSEGSYSSKGILKLLSSNDPPTQNYRNNGKGTFGIFCVNQYFHMKKIKMPVFHWPITIFFVANITSTIQGSHCSILGRVFSPLCGEMGHFHQLTARFQEKRSPRTSCEIICDRCLGLWPCDNSGLYGKVNKSGSLFICYIPTLQHLKENTLTNLCFLK